MSIDTSLNICTWNINGIKSLCIYYHGLDHVLNNLHADIICFQETKVATPLDYYNCISLKYYSYFSHYRPSKAYSGTATFVRKTLPVLAAQDGLCGRYSSNSGNDMILELTPDEVGYTDAELGLLDCEGRCIITGKDNTLQIQRCFIPLYIVDHGEFVLLNIYAPNAYTDDTDRFDFKMCYHHLLSMAVSKLQKLGRSVVIICLSHIYVS